MTLSLKSTVLVSVSRSPSQEANVLVLSRASEFKSYPFSSVGVVQLDSHSFPSGLELSADAVLRKQDNMIRLS